MNTPHQETLRPVFNAAARTALLVVDVQRQFCDPGYDRGTPTTVMVAQRIARLVPRFRAASCAVFPIYYTPYPDAAVQSYDHFHFQPAPDDTVITKTHDSAFQGTKLGEKLSAGGFTRVHVCGFNFNACVRRTAIDAAANGHITTVIVDMCGNDLWNQRKAIYAANDLRDNGVRLARAGTVLQETTLRAAATSLA